MYFAAVPVTTVVSQLSVVTRSLASSQKDPSIASMRGGNLAESMS